MFSFIKIFKKCVFIKMWLIVYGSFLVSRRYFEFVYFLDGSIPLMSKFVTSYDVNSFEGDDIDDDVIEFGLNDGEPDDEFD